MNKGNSEEEKTQLLKPATGKRYEAPAFRFDKVFEVTALSCGKLHSTELSCRLNRKIS